MDHDPTADDLLIAFLKKEKGKPVEWPKPTQGLVLSFEDAMKARAERRARLREAHD